MLVSLGGIETVDVGESVGGDDSVDDLSFACSNDFSDELSSCSYGSFQSSRHDEKRKKQREEERRGVEALAKGETKKLRIWKIVVCVSIVVTGAVVSFGTLHFLRQEEESNFEESYYAFASTIGDATKFHTRNVFHTMESCANMISASAKDTNSTWPFVTVPSFEVMGQWAREQSGLEAIFFMPIVDEASAPGWTPYSLSKQGWLQDSIEQAIKASDGKLSPDYYVPGSIVPIIYDIGYDENGTRVTSPALAFPQAPVWQLSPPPFAPYTINYNRAGGHGFQKLASAVTQAREGLMSETELFSFLSEFVLTEEEHNEYHVQYVAKDADGSAEQAFQRPHSAFMEPVFLDVFDESSEIVGYIQAVVPWDRYLVNLLPDGTDLITSVLMDTCGDTYTYQIDGNTAIYLGEGDQHDNKYDKYEVVIPFDGYMRESVKDIPGHCLYSFHVYPRKAFEDSYRSILPVTMTIVVASTFFLMALTFAAYDFFVRRKNQKVVNAAARSNAILSKMFPKAIRDRLVEEELEKEEAEEKAAQAKRSYRSEKARIKNFLKEDAWKGEKSHEAFHTKPIADLFPETTVLFAGIVGFSSWSSAREPSQVFTLLETIYKSFDHIARKMKVFKVETVGETYVAVTGVPDRSKNHAVVMGRFATACLKKFGVLTRKLEVTLGPDTADLGLRIGIHSGPVTGGVLRGDRSRFQLFGDTMGVGARMEATSFQGKIQVSQATADYLKASDKESWLCSREVQITAAGKSDLINTFWLDVSGAAAPSEGRCSWFELGEDHSEDLDADDLMLSEKITRLVKWNVEMLSNLLKQIQARRSRSEAKPHRPLTAIEHLSTASQTVPLDEVVEIISLPTFGGESVADDEAVELAPEVLDQLEDFVSAVAASYNDNPFHNFEHASHVCSSVLKLLSRIVAPDLEEGVSDNMASALHDHTYGITSDPLTQFACVFSALIHDADHVGVPNTKLIEEKPDLATIYNNKSIAEQNSVDLSWSLLMSDRYTDLRGAIYSTIAEFERFRQLVVNSVMATDIMDKDLKVLRNSRWDKAFNDVDVKETAKASTDRKATIVLEHLIQASDVAHTMQHWTIYTKFNERLFRELYKSYKEGRTAFDPTKGDAWFKGELGFFDFYIIPLAKKLKDCGVFGVSSDEYLQWALSNRREWESSGERVCSEMKERAIKEFGG